MEPRGKGDLKTVMNAYYAKILQPGSKGACFLAVCRGKVIILMMFFVFSLFTFPLTCTVIKNKCIFLSC